MSNTCFKVIDEKCPSSKPLTPGEAAVGANSDDFQWDCTDSENPGSVCSKTCLPPYKKIGQPYSVGKYECVCADECKWIRSVTKFEKSLRMIRI